MNRKSFLTKGALATGSLVFISSYSIAQEAEGTFSLEEIKDFVFAAHKDYDETKRIIELKPLLLNCANQPQKGDFETALGGASHMGRRDIADLLVSKGARMDIFNQAFLGYDNFVMQQINDYPHLLNTPGPHGFTLLHHAKVGERKNLANWLQEKGLSETFFKGIFG